MKKAAIGMIAVAASIGLATATPQGKATLVSASDMKWTEMPNTGGVQTVPLVGDMTKGAHAVLVKFPAGSTHPLHIHTAEIKMVVVSGTLTYGPEGGPDKSYGPGSYIVIPGGLRHTSGCAKGSPCVLFHEATGKFDFEPAAKKPSR